jgi:uncharacterized membrane protein YebE (DUF533 family)
MSTLIYAEYLHFTMASLSRRMLYIGWGNGREGEKMVKFTFSALALVTRVRYNTFMGRVVRSKNQEAIPMSDSTAVNYTPAMESVIIAAAPLNMEKAKAIGGQIGKSYRSVIAKAKSLGVDYEGKPKAAKRIGGMTKPQMVEAIAAAVGTDAAALEGLEKSTASSLGNLLAACSRVG